MKSRYPISPPTTYVAAVAVGVADSEGSMSLVGEDAPMPVTVWRHPVPEPLSGAVTQSSIAGPFAPVENSPMHLELRGEWVGSVELQRSIDGGVNRTSLTVAGMPWARFTACVNEVVWVECEKGATFYLDIKLTSGTLSYRLSQ